MVALAWQRHRDIDVAGGNVDEGSTDRRTFVRSFNTKASRTFGGFVSTLIFLLT